MAAKPVQASIAFSVTTDLTGPELAEAMKEAASAGERVLLMWQRGGRYVSSVTATPARPRSE